MILDEMEVAQRDCCELPCGVCDECGSHILFGIDGGFVPRGWLGVTCDNDECEADLMFWNPAHIGDGIIVEGFGGVLALGNVTRLDIPEGKPQ